MATNAFYCRKCKCYTRHVEISCREHAALVGCNPVVSSIVGLCMDFTGMKHLTFGLEGHRFYKCCKCGRPSERNLKGEEC